MRRRALVSLVLLTLVAAACQPPPPPNWVPPTIDSLVVSPDPVVAGSTFTVTVTASDDSLVNRLQIAIRPPYRLISSYDPPYEHATCEGSDFDPAPVVTRVFTCTLPEFSPNGRWNVSATAGDDHSADYVGGERFQFDLVGGSEDREDPVLESVVISPDPVVIGQPFDVTVRISDEHLVPDPMTLTFANPSPPNPTYWSCGAGTVPVQLTPTVQEWRFESCEVPPERPPGGYRLLMTVHDAIGHQLHVRGAFDAVAAP